MAGLFTCEFRPLEPGASLKPSRLDGRAFGELTITAAPSSLSPSSCFSTSLCLPFWKCARTRRLCVRACSFVCSLALLDPSHLALELDRLPLGRRSSSRPRMRAVVHSASPPHSTHEKALGTPPVW